MCSRLTRTKPSGPLSSVKVAAVVLAAGQASRMGANKLLLPLDGRSMIRRVVDAAVASQVCGVVVVVGHDAEAVADQVSDCPVSVVVNDHYSEGLSTTVRTGVSQLDPTFAGAIFLQGDQPFLSEYLIDALLRSFAVDTRRIVRPSFAGQPMTPVLFSARFFPELAAESGDRGGRRVIERHASEVRLVEIDDPHVCLDIDTSGEYERARAS